jgi:GTP-dependent phosphoenolpyruvate carboxykinase
MSVQSKTASQEAKTTNPKVLAFVEEARKLFKPDQVVWCDGSKAEYQRLLKSLVDGGTAMWLNPDKRPNSIIVRSDPLDVARVEDQTYICSKSKDDAGPTNNWFDPAEMKATLIKLYDGAMAGRTMYVLPYSMGPVGSPIAGIGVMVTDSAYAVANMHIMTRVGDKVWKALGQSDDFVRGMHTVGYPLSTPTTADVPWPGKTKPSRTSPRRERSGPTARARRQRAARQEMPRAAHREREGARRRLDGRAHADPQAHQPGREIEVHRRGLPERVRQDQSRHAEPDHSRLEGRDDWR